MLVTSTGVLYELWQVLGGCLNPYEWWVPLGLY